MTAEPEPEPEPGGRESRFYSHVRGRPDGDALMKISPGFCLLDISEWIRTGVGFLSGSGGVCFLMLFLGGLRVVVDVCVFAWRVFVGRFLIYVFVKGNFLVCIVLYEKLKGNDILLYL